MNAPNKTQYKVQCLQTGLCKQTLLSGLPSQAIGVPKIFMMDIMHLSVLNDPDLLLGLWRGTIDCYKPDNQLTWDWATLSKQKIWISHGDTVVTWVVFIPSSFGCAPRNPAKKINSGYKAWEFEIYIYGIGPTLFRHILPAPYWRNFCKLVTGIWILQRHVIAREDLHRAHQLLCEFAQEFEDLYSRSMEARIHFVRHSIHLLTHMAPETVRASPLSCYAQWALETIIGNLGREIRSDREPYANLTERAVLRAQTNSLRAQYPGVKIDVREKDPNALPPGARDLGGRYALLPRCDSAARPLSVGEYQALMKYWEDMDWPNKNNWPNGVVRWARLRLPNGQRARSTWFESTSQTPLRQTSCVEVCISLFLFILGYLNCSY